MVVNRDCTELDVIIDYGSVFVTDTEKLRKRNRVERSPFFRPRCPLIKLIGAANLQSSVIALKFLP